MLPSSGTCINHVVHNSTALFLVLSSTVTAAVDRLIIILSTVVGFVEGEITVSHYLPFVLRRKMWEGRGGEGRCSKGSHYLFISSIMCYYGCLSNSLDE